MRRALVLLLGLLCLGSVSLVVAPSATTPWWTR
jgi:hypothetical protein